ncbi:MAG TPA: DUF5343 domain-containing protein [Candidatus Paceibacterota bacterium]
MNNHERISTPPYLSVRKITEMVDLVSSRNYPEGISAEFFKNRGFGSADATLAVNTLKFLNLLKEDGTPTEEMSAMRIKGDSRKPEFQKIIRVAYKKLFETVDNPHELPKDKLATELIAVYKLSDRVVSGAIPAFYKFCMYAGLKEEKGGSTPSVKKDSPKSTSLPLRKSTPMTDKGASPRSGFSALPIADGKLELHLSEQWKNKLLSDESIENKWRTVRTALKELADALGESDLKGKEG